MKVIKSKSIIFSDTSVVRTSSVHVHTCKTVGDETETSKLKNGLFKLLRVVEALKKCSVVRVRE